ncbi:hypothetical protein Sjap_005735 [Stephania japonica]|uniref:Uncharacterized protein n=1 Tax=Stephania japonica TaxID=461633 RepID=A0AAP0K732_9MAGN
MWSTTFGEGCECRNSRIPVFEISGFDTSRALAREPSVLPALGRMKVPEEHPTH